MDFLLVLNELFSLGVSNESLRAKRDRKSAISLQRGQFDTKFQECDFRRKSAVLRFETPFGGLGARTMIILGLLESA